MTAEFAAVFTSLKTTSDIAKALMSLRDTALIQSKVIELQGEILSAQAGTLAAQESQSTLLQRVRDLEKEVADLKAWDAEKQKYQLTDLGRGAFAYTLKEQASSPEPQHSICPNCYQDSRKSILQRVTLPIGQVQVLRCLGCEAEINLTGREYAGPRPSGGFVRRR